MDILPQAPTESISLAALLGEIVAYIGRYLALSAVQADALALWVAHTYVVYASDVAAYLHVTSPEKRCGKTRLFEVLELIVANPWMAGRPTVAALIRKTHKEHPTLLCDEVDRSLKSGDEYANTLIGVLNAGYRRGLKYSVCVPPSFEVRDFQVFGPKAFAGIGRLPDTIEDRCIRIELKRKLKGEVTARFKYRDARAAADLIRKQLETWAPGAVELVDANPKMPEALSDRAEEIWEPLIAIADLAGGPWPDRARSCRRHAVGRRSRGR